MTRVIAVQEEQLSKLKENYNKNIPVKTNAVVNNANVLSESISVPSMDVQSVTPIDMEGQVVNLNSSVFQNNNGIPNLDATNEVFGPQIGDSNAVVSTPLVNTNNAQEVSIPSLNNGNVANPLDVPYLEPNVGTANPVNVMNDDSFYELLNSLRNMITDFANNAYAKIDKFQEERLQNLNTGANLIDRATPDLVKEETKIDNFTVVSNEHVPVVGSVTNIFDSQLGSDLDKTIVIPNGVITSALNEAENEMKMRA